MAGPRNLTGVRGVEGDMPRRNPMLGLFLGVVACLAAVCFVGPDAEAKQNRVRLEVLKSDHTLVVYAGDAVLNRYPIGV